jgi:phosphoglucomutase/phosphopentomutase
MVTASHNPKDDNGYKVYFSNGAQITSPHDINIQNQIMENLEPWNNVWNNNPRDNPKCTDPLDLISQKYFFVIKSRIFDRHAIKASQLRVTYTSLHGVGHRYMTEALKTCELSNYFPVESQMKPDPEFPTVVFPNPEEGKGVLVRKLSDLRLKKFKKISIY